MKLKQVCLFYQTVIVFMVLFFLRPNLPACVPNPTNYTSTIIRQPVLVSQANIVPIVNERLHPPDQPQPKVWGLVVAFIIAILVIGYILSQIIRMLDKVIPPLDKKPDPPPNSGNTNYPPVVINPTDSPGPAIRAKKYEGNMLAYTNSTGCTITNYNIATFMWANTWEKGNTNIVFDHYWAVSLSTSTNMVDWRDTHYQVECFYTTSVGVLYRYRHYDTNFYQCYYRSDYILTNHAAPAYFDLTDKPYQPNQFFKLNPK